MPIRWYGPADPSNPTYRHFDRVVNLCLHAALFAAINSGLWVRSEEHTSETPVTRSSRMPSSA